MKKRRLRKYKISLDFETDFFTIQTKIRRWILCKYYYLSFLRDEMWAY